MKYLPITETMLAAARAAGDLLTKLQAQPIPDSGSSNSPSADSQAQDLIVAELRKGWPNVPIIGEEQDHSELQITHQKFFTVDPLDNTVVYEAGYPTGWGTMIAYVEEFQVVAGVIFLPGDRELFVAEKDRGCWRNGDLWRIDYALPLGQAIIDIEIDRRLDKHCIDTVLTPLIANTATIKSNETVVGVDVLRNRLALWVFVRGTGKKGAGIWDFTAPTIAVQEAGGVACTPHGEDLKFDRIDMNGVVFAANEGIASEAVTLMSNW